jgi:hypothetical protein
MARLKKGSVPTLRRHKPTGKAIVTLSGQDFYCGPWGTKVALSLNTIGTLPNGLLADRPGRQGRLL